MRRFAITLGMASLALANTAMAADDAAPAATPEALSKCLTMKSTGQDRLTFAGWMVAALASAPQMKGVATLAPGKKDELDRDVARVFTRLIAVDCAEFSRPLMKDRNNSAFRTGGEALGRMAMQELLSNPDAAKAMEAFAKYIDPMEFLAPGK